MARFRDYVEQGGTKIEKIDSLNDYVYNNFEQARNLLCAVHEIDLKRWAIRKARTMSLHDCVASDRWVSKFKNNYNICSRKIIKIRTCFTAIIQMVQIIYWCINTINPFQVVTKRELINETEIKRSAAQFVTQVKLLLPCYNGDYVWNTAQSGLRLQFPSTRNLSYQGEKTTIATVRSINATTHSYTVQPTISMSGKIVGPIYLCLKEVNGRISENIKSNLPPVENVVVTCSASGKLTTSLVEYWRDNCLMPSLSLQKTLLLSDSWSGQAGGKGIYESVKGLKRLEIPWKTTSKIQPLDVFFNRQWKVIVCKVYERSLLMK